MKTVSLAFGAGQTIRLDLIGNYFHLLETTGPVTIDFAREGAVFATAQNMEFGFYSRPADGFSSLSFTSASAQTIKFAVGFGDGGYDRITGSVTLLGMQSAFAQGRVSLTNANQEIIAANASRRYVMIQNNDAAQVMRIKVDGVAATAAQGFRIQPGGYLELAGYACTGAIHAIMEAASVAVGNCEFTSG